MKELFWALKGTRTLRIGICTMSGAGDCGRVLCHVFVMVFL